MQHNYAVLTGDIIGSGDLGPDALGAAIAALENASRDIEGAAFARRGGDGWQAAFPAPGRALRHALTLRAALRTQGKDRSTRIAIAAGPGTIPGGLDPNAAHGPAFTASGRLLEALPSGATMAHAAGGALDAATRLADHISTAWTPAQARAMEIMLPPGAPIRAGAAKQLGITRQAVNQALWSAGYPALDAALNLIEDAS
jgi:hypothetical protein